MVEGKITIDNLVRDLAAQPMDRLARLFPWLPADVQAEIRNRAVRRLFRRWFGAGGASAMADAVRNARSHLARDDDSRHADLVRVNLLGGATLSKRQLRRIACSDGPAWPECRTDPEKSTLPPPQDDAAIAS